MTQQPKETCQRTCRGPKLISKFPFGQNTNEKFFKNSALAALNRG